MDRRTRKTKNLLWNSLINLILEKGYEKVTIKDIIEKADVGRSTFYSHYESKEQLLFCGQAHLLLPIFANENKKNEEVKINFIEILNHAKENKQLTKSILKGHLKIQLYEHIDNFLKDKLENSINLRQKNIEKTNSDLLVNATSSAITSLILNWIKKDTAISITEMEEMINKIICSILDIKTNNLLITSTEKSI